MRSFEDWVKETLREINKADIEDKYKIYLLAELKALKELRHRDEFRIAIELFIAILHRYKLQNFCPTQEEIQYWILRG